MLKTSCGMPSRLWWAVGEGSYELESIDPAGPDAELAYEASDDVLLAVLLRCGGC
jgi:hypothetical protein